MSIPGTEQIRALQLLLKQVRAAGGAWSDGQRVLRGSDLTDYRAGIVDRILAIRHRNVPRNGDATQARAPKDTLPWRNAAQLLGMMRRANPAGTGHISDILLSWTIERPADPASAQRRRIAARAIRRHFPHLLTASARPGLVAENRERDAILASMSRRAWILRQDVHIGPKDCPVILPKDSPVHFGPQGFELRTLGERIFVPPDMVRRLRARDRLRIDRADAIPDSGRPEV